MVRWNGLATAGVSALAVVATLTGSAFAQSVPDPDQTQQGDVSLTIYNRDLALVQDVRELEIAATIQHTHSSRPRSRPAPISQT